MQFDANAKVMSSRPELITFDSCPEPEIKDDAEAEAQNLLGKVPEFMFELHTGLHVPGVGAEGNEPFILREAHRSPVHGQLPCECGLPRPWQPAGEKQPGLAHCDLVKQASGIAWSRQRLLYGRGHQDPSREGPMSARDTAHVAHRKLPRPMLSVAVSATTLWRISGRSTNEKENAVTRLLLAAAAGGHDDDDNLFSLFSSLPVVQHARRVTAQLRGLAPRPRASTHTRRGRAPALYRTNNYLPLMASGDLPSVTIGRCRHFQ